MTIKTADLYDEHAERLQVVEPIFRSFGGRVAFHGPISTVKTHEDNSRVREAVSEAGNGRVLVVDGGGSLRCALVGDVLAGKAAANGWAGLVIWGCIRDVAEVRALDVGCLALATMPAKSIKRGAGQRDEAVSFGGVRFVPGHTLYADEDGVLVSESPLH